MLTASSSRRLAFIACFFALGCQPSIGDHCVTNADCSLTGDRICDTTSLNGYCTQFNCLPGGCPDEAACVGFYTKLASECMGLSLDQRFERSFCMKKCSSDGDCRQSEGYACLDPTVDTDVSARVLETGDAASTSVCMVKLNPAVGDSGMPLRMSLPKDAGICVAPEPTFPEAAPPRDSAVSNDGASPGEVGARDAARGSDASVPDASKDAATDVRAAP